MTAWKNACPCLLALALAAAWATGSAAIPPELGSLPPNAREKPEALEGVRFEQRLGDKVPLDVALVDESGRAVKLGDYFGRRPVILTLVYFRCPKLCTLVLNGLAEALQGMNLTAGKEFDVVTVSFDPKDTPETAREKKENYLALYGRPEAAKGWHFLTGQEDAIRRLTDAVGFHYRYDPLSNEYAHASGIMIVTAEGRLSRYLYGISYAARDVRLSLVEASKGQVGSPVDAILLYCFHYDPQSGKYNASVLNFVRLGGGLTVLALLGFFAVLGVRSRRQPAPTPPSSG